MKASIRKRQEAIKANAAKIQQSPPLHVAANMLNLMVGLRYWEEVLANPHPYKYLQNYHPEDLRELQDFLQECTRRHAKRSNGTVSTQC